MDTLIIEKIDIINDQIALFDHVVGDDIIFEIDFMTLMLEWRSYLFAQLESED